jgi:FecR-like protein
MNDHDRDAEFQNLLDQARRLPKSIEPPRDLWPGIRERMKQGRGEGGRGKWWVTLAAAAVLLAVVLWNLIPRGAGWVVEREAGRPVVGSARLAASGRLREGQWIVTDDSSRVRVQVGTIGTMEVSPGSRVQLLASRPDAQHLALAHGAITVKVDADSGVFVVETPAATAVDLGCAYTLEVDSLGRGRLHVTQGRVAFEWAGRRSLVPMGSAAETRPGVGPGIPYTLDAPPALRAALEAFDFANGGPTAARAAVTSARAEDALSLWHLLGRVDADQRAMVYDRLAALVPPPPGVTRAEALRLDAPALARYWETIRRIAWRREILRGVRELDPRTGTAKH